MTDNKCINNIIISEDHLEEDSQNQRIIEESEYPEIANKDCVDKITSDLSCKIEDLLKRIVVLKERIIKVEKDIEIKEISGKLSKHYEQSRYRK